MAPKVPPSGVWCPAVTLFDRASDTVDLAAQRRYFAHLATTGLAGLVVLGTNAEALLLTREERRALVRLAREAAKTLDADGGDGDGDGGGVPIPLMAGVGGHSTRQVVEFAADAAAEGADYVLVLPPGYFKVGVGNLMGEGGVVERFYDDVAAECARLGVGVVIYNFPGVCNGVDLDRYV